MPLDFFFLGKTILSNGLNLSKSSSSPGEGLPQGLPAGGRSTLASVTAMERAGCRSIGKKTPLLQLVILVQWEIMANARKSTNNKDPLEMQDMSQLDVHK